MWHQVISFIINLITCVYELYLVFSFINLCIVVPKLPTFIVFLAEFGLEGFVSTKCDVYSFGIMIMEVFTRTIPSDKMFGENLDMKNWVKDSMPNALSNVIDPNLLSSASESFADIMVCISSIMEVALNCTRESAKERSNIGDVVASLKKIKLQLLPYKGGLQGACMLLIFMHTIYYYRVHPNSILYLDDC